MSIVGVESNPNLQPAKCSFSGRDSSNDSKFIRLMAPEEDWDTILISDTFFNEMAKLMGYVKISDEDVDAAQLKEAVNGLDAVVPSVLAELAQLRAQLAGVQTLDARIERFDATLRSILKATGSAEQSVEPAGVENTSGVRTATVANKSPKP